MQACLSRLYCKKWHSKLVTAIYTDTNNLRMIGEFNSDLPFQDRSERSICKIITLNKQR